MEGPELRRQRLPIEQVGRAVEWAIGKGCDTVLIEADPEAQPFDPLVIQHVCTDPRCPGGCDWSDREVPLPSWLTRMGHQG